jgi:quercetin dioxygenase-like cupin family protein
MSKAVFDTQSVAVTHLLATSPVVRSCVVSKPLLQTDSCEVIVFAMDGGQTISEHHAPYIATVQVLDGRLDLTLAGKRHVLAPGDWLLIPFDVKHDLTAVEPTRFLLTVMR